MLSIGVLAFRPIPLENQRWQSLATYLEQKIPNVRVNLQTYDFPGLEAAVQGRMVDIVITNPSDYLRYAHQMGLSAPIASIVEQYEDAPLHGFGGTILVPASRTDLTTLRDLKGKRIAASAKESLGGYQAQAYELLKEHIQLPEDAELVLTGLPHDSVLAALEKGAGGRRFCPQRHA